MPLHLVTPQIIFGVEDVAADGALVLALRLPLAQRLARPRPADRSSRCGMVLR
jgi:hypothetical protein